MSYCEGCKTDTEELPEALEWGEKQEARAKAAEKSRDEMAAKLAEERTKLKSAEDERIEWVRRGEAAEESRDEMAAKLADIIEEPAYKQIAALKEKLAVAENAEKNQIEQCQAFRKTNASLRSLVEKQGAALEKIAGAGPVHEWDRDALIGFALAALPARPEEKP